MIPESPSTRRAWIEIPTVRKKEFFKEESPSTRRAWIEMIIVLSVALSTYPSPSTRRAWIEMAVRCARKASATVALHPEGVDRNSVEQVRPLTLSDLSPSTRRAWIEIGTVTNAGGLGEGRPPPGERG